MLLKFIVGTLEKLNESIFSFTAVINGYTTINKESQLFLMFIVEILDKIDESVSSFKTVIYP